MPKKRKSEKSNKGSTTATKVKGSSGSKKSTSTGKKTGYKRGSLSSVIFAYIHKTGVDEVVYDKMLELAQKTMPNTKFNRYHYSWYKNKYRKLVEEGKI